MISLAKADAILRDVADKLTKRYAGSATIDTVRQARDSNGFPMIFLSDGGVETVSNPVIALRMSPVDMVSKDIFGNQTYAYAPHVLEVAYELTGANNPIPADADILIAEFEAIKTGCRIQLKEITNSNAVTAANMDNSSIAPVALDIEELNWPTKSV